MYDLSKIDYAFPCEYERPFDHQVETFMFMLKYPRSYILNTMGTGKTLTALWATDYLIIKNKIRRILIISTLSSLKPTWSHEILTHLPHRSFTILHGTRKERLINLRKDVDYFLINHDGIKTIEDELTDYGFDAVIIDESTAYKTHSSDRSKCAKRLCQDIRAVWSMTGEPTPCSPLEAYSQAIITTPKNPNLPTSFYKYRDQVMLKIDEATYVPKEGWQNAVAKILRPSIRFTLRECVDLPETIVVNREVGLSKEQHRMYAQMKKEYIAQYKDGLITASNAGVKYLKLLQISAGTVFDENKVPQYLECNNKLNEILEIFYQTEQRKLIVFALFRPLVRRIVEFLRHKGIKAAGIMGGMNKNERSDNIQNFQFGDLEVVVAQPKTVAHSITWTAANYILWFTPAPSNEIYNQANSRIVRPGQTRVQYIMRLFSSESEKRVYAVHEEQADMSALLMDILKNGG